MSLISKAKAGDLNALSELIEDLELIMYKTAKAILINEEDVNDAIQEALFSIYRNLDGLKEEKYFKTWSTRILINKCYDIINKNNVNNQKTLKMQEKYEIDNQNTKLEQKTEVEIALNHLDEDLKLTTIMYYYNDFSVKEIAKLLNIPTGTVKSRLSRARNKLYDVLRHEEVQIDER